MRPGRIALPLGLTAILVGVLYAAHEAAPSPHVALLHHAVIAARERSFTSEVRLEVPGLRRPFESAITVRHLAGERTVPPMFGRFLACPILDADLAARNYELEPTPGGLRMIPRHEGRPTYVLGLDEESGLVNAFEALGPDGDTLIRWRHESIAWGEPELPPRRVRPEAAEPAFALFLPRTPPAGYRIADVRAMSRFGSTHVMVTYTDGVSLVMLVQGEAQDSDPPEGTVDRWVRHGVVGLRMRHEGTRILYGGLANPEELVESLRTLEPTEWSQIRISQAHP